MPKKKYDHIHTLRRQKKNTYFCTHPNCYFRIQKDFLLGKEVMCPSCEKPFILSSYELKLAIPKCPFCQKSKKADLLNTARAGISSVLAELLDEENANTGAEISTPTRE